jgi:hypothetical protein
MSYNYLSPAFYDNLYADAAQLAARLANSEKAGLPEPTLLALGSSCPDITFAAQLAISSQCVITHFIQTGVEYTLTVHPLRPNMRGETIDKFNVKFHFNNDPDVKFRHNAEPEMRLALTRHYFPRLAKERVKEAFKSKL